MELGVLGFRVASERSHWVCGNQGAPKHLGQWRFEEESSLCVVIVRCG